MRRSIPVILGGLAASAAIFWLVQTLRFTSWDFRNNLWAPAHLLVNGHSPYNISLLFDNSRAVWLPMGPGLFFVLGWLTQYQAANVWLLGNLAMLIGIVWLASGYSRPRPRPFAICLLLVLLFPATVSHLVLGQFTVVTVLVLLIAARLLKAPRLWLIGFLVVVALIKPQLALLGVPGILLYILRHHGWRMVGALAGTCALWVIALTLPLWLGHPAWFSDFWTMLGQNPLWAQPTLFSILSHQFGALGLVIWLLLSLSVFAVSMRLWLTRHPEEAMIWSLALTPLVSPYMWSWDFVVILPLFVWSVFHLKMKLAQVILALGYLLCWGIMIWIRMTTENSDERFWWLPPTLLLFVVGAQALQARSANTLANEVLV